MRINVYEPAQMWDSWACFPIHAVIVAIGHPIACAFHIWQSAFVVYLYGAVLT